LGFWDLKGNKKAVLHTEKEPKNSPIVATSKIEKRGYIAEGIDVPKRVKDFLVLKKKKSVEQ